MRIWKTLLVVCVCSTAPAYAQGFKFSNEDQAQRAEQEAEAARQARARVLLATPCRDKIKNQKIMVLLGEVRNGAVFAGQAAYGSHVNAINQRLRSLGLRTYSPEEIRQQVAQAEIDAYFRNDPDAALSASRRLAAQYILRGVIATQTSRKAYVNVNQVNVHMDFTLTGANGKMISQAIAKNESYAGSDVSGMALTLINERADEVVGQLYSDYCRQAGVR
jgi:hypothetical protein